MGSELATPDERRALSSFDAALAAERGAEQTMMRSITRAVIIGIPIGIAFFVALLALALAGDTEWYVIVGLGAVLGVLGAVLFGILGGVVLAAHVFEDVDRGTPTGH